MEKENKTVDYQSLAEELYEKIHISEQKYMTIEQLSADYKTELQNIQKENKESYLCFLSK